MTFKKILLTGGSGKLGTHIINSKLFPNLMYPSENVLDITKPYSIEEIFKNEEIDAVIHSAATARMSDCEANPDLAISVNIIGTANLVKKVIEAEKKYQHNIRFIHISTDGVYPSIRGNYSEKDETIPYNTYGWTKLGAESAVNTLNNYYIIRTRFFDPQNIPFKESATDIFTSSIPVDELVKAIHKILTMDFTGIVNIGGKRMSDYERFKAYKPSLRSCKRKDIIKDLSFEIAMDASMDCSLWKRLSSLK